MIMIMKPEMENKIDWDALDSCWADRYEEDYGHFSNNYHVLSDIQIVGPAAAEA